MRYTVYSLEGRFILTAEASVITQLFRMHPDAMKRVASDLGAARFTKLHFNGRSPLNGLEAVIICNENFLPTVGDLRAAAN